MLRSLKDKLGGTVDLVLLRTCMTFNPCCLKFTLLSTAKILALNKVQCSIWSFVQFPPDFLVLAQVGLGQEQ